MHRQLYVNEQGYTRDGFGKSNDFSSVLFGSRSIIKIDHIKWTNDTYILFLKNDIRYMKLM